MEKRIAEDFESELEIFMETQDCLWKIEKQKDQTISHSLELI
jgi:hypothetical protein